GGGMDSGKSTLGRKIAEAAARGGRVVAYIDADLGQKTVGPPTSVTLRVLREAGHADSESMTVPDALYFVGSTSPQGQLLPLVVGTGRMLTRAWVTEADLAVVDRS